MRRIYPILAFLVILVPVSFGQWEKRSVLQRDVYSLLSTPEGLLASTYVSLYHSANNAHSWDSLASFPGPTELLQVGEVLLSVARWEPHRHDMTPLASIFRSGDWGQTWDSVLASEYGVSSIALCGSRLYANPDGRLSSSSDTGKTWTRADTAGILPRPPLGVSPGVIGRVFSDATTVYVWSLSGASYRSTDQGVSWDSLTTDIPPGAISVLAHDGALYVGTYEAGFFFSSDRGETWRAMNMGLPDSARQIGPLFLVQNHLLASSTKDSIHRVYRLRLTDTTWERFDSGLTLGPDDYVFHFAKNEEYLFLAAGGHAIWRRPLSDLVAGVEDALLSPPLSIMLEQNYPNPFNPSTTIRYAVPHRTHVRLSVFNTLGQMVRTLVDREVQAGYHEVQFDASGQASGGYFYRLQAGDFTQTRKLCLTK